MNKTRVYMVEDTESIEGPRMVRAESLAQARRWVLGQYIVRLATTDELIEALQDNEQLHDANEFSKADDEQEAAA